MDPITIVCASKRNRAFPVKMSTVVDGARWRVTNFKTVIVEEEKKAWGVGKYCYYDVKDSFEIGMITESTETSPGKFEYVFGKTDAIPNEVNVHGLDYDAKKVVAKCLGVPPTKLMAGSGRTINGRYALTKQVVHEVTYWPQLIELDEVTAPAGTSNRHLNVLEHVAPAPEVDPGAAGPSNRHLNVLEPVVPEPVAPEHVAPELVVPEPVPEPVVPEPVVPGPGGVTLDDIAAGLDFFKSKFDTIATSAEVSNLVERSVVKINQVEANAAKMSTLEAAVLVLNAKIETQGAALNAKVDANKAETDGKIETQGAALNAKVDANKAETDGKIDEIKEALEDIDSKLQIIVDKAPEMVQDVAGLKLAVVQLIKNPTFGSCSMAALGM
jgi:hypothetical protein